MNVSTLLHEDSYTLLFVWATKYRKSQMKIRKLKCGKSPTGTKRTLFLWSSSKKIKNAVTILEIRWFIVGSALTSNSLVRQIKRGIVYKIPGHNKAAYAKITHTKTEYSTGKMKCKFLDQVHVNIIFKWVIISHEITETERGNSFGRVSNEYSAHIALCPSKQQK